MKEKKKDKNYFQAALEGLNSMQTGVDIPAQNEWKSSLIVSSNKKCQGYYPGPSFISTLSTTLKNMGCTTP